ncbi:MAG TPA: porin [Hyphomicrobiaceae bacterium]|nr:porin [Hyphomicrobiaceae bacterium]
MTARWLQASVSGTALLAAALMIVPGSNAQAADLGGNCCADLEERVAELEATTVRKGNRKVSLTISGFVAHNVMFWDDGVQSDMYIGDGGNYGSRFRFVGTAKISPNVTAGFLYEFGVANNGLNAMNQLNGGDDLGSTFALRDSTVWLRHNQLGMIKVGHGSTATDNLILIDLGGLSGATTPDIALYNGSFILRNPVTSLGFPIVSLTWDQLILGRQESYDTSRRNHVLYETPSLAGFTLQAAVAEDNFWDVALRYAGEFGGFRLAAGIGYRQDSEFNQTNQLLNVGGALCASQCERVQSVLLGSASILHVPTGLFVTGAAGSREDENFLSLIGATDNRNAKSSFWHLTAGISNNFTGLGRTVFYGEYAEHNDALRHFFSDVTGSDVKYWGLGVVQHIDAAAMEIFIAYKNYDASFTRNVGTLAAPVIESVNFDAFSTVIVGTRINF